MKQETEHLVPEDVYTHRTLTALEKAVMQTVAYVDVFDYPLTTGEIHRYLVGIQATRSEVETALASLHSGKHLLLRSGDSYALAGRESAFVTRRRNEANSQRLWSDAARYARLIERLPFVRMIAVTGSLAVCNAGPGADIDYLIVTETGRLWLCRALVIVVVRLAARQRITLCPNYFLAEQSLAFTSQNLYTARELVQMVPLFGYDVYRALRGANTWTRAFLPNADGIPHTADPPPTRAARGRILAEWMLRTRAGGLLESWEMDRKIRRLTPEGSGAFESDYCADWCKGHIDNHGRRILRAYAKRIDA